jgi:uncharacterized damage-inducible protein DinB
MNTKETIRSNMGITDMVFKTYLSDLSDADLMTRPSEGCNHVAWQVGHLISSEVGLINQIAPGKGMELPDGFADAHSKEQAGNDDASAFRSKDEYLALYDKVREASAAVLEEMTDEQMDEAGPEHFKQLCPTKGAMFNLVATHPMMHAGQLAVARRVLGKPVLI